MSRPKQLSGDDIVGLLATYGFAVASARGMHVKLRRNVGRGVTQSVTFPRGKDLDPLTVTAVFRHVAQYIPEERLRSRFFTQ